MNILISGIHGFLGSHLANELVKHHNVIGLYNKNKNNIIDPSIITFNDIDLIEKVPDIIIMNHAAVVSGNSNINKDVLLKVNADFTKRILDRFPESKSIYVSSVSVYGNKNHIIDENSKPNPITDYAESKYKGEQFVLEKKNNVVVRFPSIYGEGMKENTIIPNYCNQAIQNKKIEVWGTGDRLQNYIHVSDAVRLIELILEKDLEINFPILGVSKEEYSNSYLAGIISKETNSKMTFSGNDSSSSWVFNNSKTKETLHWESQITLSYGIKKYLEWKKTQ